MILTEKYKLLNQIRFILESWWIVPILFLIGTLCWWFSLSLLTVAIFATIAILILLFCKNVNNLFALFFYVSFFIKNIESEETNWTGYIVFIGLAVLFMLAFTIKMLIVEKPQLKNAKLIIAIAISTLAFLLGGIIGMFDLLVTAIVFGFSVATLVLYLIARFRTKDLEKYLAYLFIVGGIFLTVNICFHRLAWAGTIFIGKPEGELFFFSAQALNTTSIFIMLAIVGCYRIGAGKKYDMQCFVLSLFFYGSVILTCCRTTIFVSSLVMIAIYVLFIKYSKARIKFLWLTLALVVAFALSLIVFREYVGSLLNMIREKISSGFNGRDELWPWCIEKFKQYPIFGYGFVADEYVPSLRTYTTVVLAHNTLLQWLTSLGIVGTLLMGVFYFYKYKILFDDVGRRKLFIIISVIAIEIAGMFDQAPSMDTFTYILVIVLISASEGINRRRSKPKKIEDGQLLG